MKTMHVVRQGEHLAGIAHQYGFADWQLIWNDPANAEVKARRRNPNILYPGDRLEIPELHAKEYERPTEERHRFRLRSEPLQLRVRLHRLYGHAFAGNKCLWQEDSRRSNLTTGKTGELDQSILNMTSQVSLTLEHTVNGSAGSVPIRYHLRLLAGHLDPIDTPSGQCARLLNLGYYQGPLEPGDPVLLASAVEEFQCEHGLLVDGRCGPQTQAKLKAVYGC
jgi:putative peptidoglycan binding protein